MKFHKDSKLIQFEFERLRIRFNFYKLPLFPLFKVKRGNRNIEIPELKYFICVKVFRRSITIWRMRKNESYN